MASLIVHTENDNSPEPKEIRTILNKSPDYEEESGVHCCNVTAGGLKRSF